MHLNGVHLARTLGEWRSTGSGYQALADRIRLLILDGRLPLRTRLPAERELAGALGISRTTVSAAYQALRTEGFLQSRRGSGSWTDVPPSSRPPDQLSTLDPSDHLDLAHAAPAAPPEILHQAASKALTQLPRYLHTDGYDSLGLPVLREAIADYYTGRGLATTADQIAVTSGAQAGFVLAMRLLCRPGDRVVVEHPTYPNVLDAIADAGCRAVPVPMTDEGWDLAAAGSAIRQAGPALGYFIPDFQNPTGQCMSSVAREELAELAARTRTPLVIDETAVHLGLDGPPPEPLACHDTAGMAITVGVRQQDVLGRTPRGLGPRSGEFGATPRGDPGVHRPGESDPGTAHRCRAVDTIDRRGGTAASSPSDSTRLSHWSTFT